jgi:small subunit ribosomal protein S17
VPGKRQEQQGVVVSDKMDKTVVVQVERFVRHPVYKKYVRRKAKYKAHDPQNRCRIGDQVEIVETRPLSRDKRWMVRSIIKAAATE